MSDAVAIVVSEESGTISVAVGGQLIRNLDEGRLKMILTGALSSHGSVDEQGAAAGTDSPDIKGENEDEGRSLRRLVHLPWRGRVKENPADQGAS